jgi:hypothetical protein
MIAGTMAFRTDGVAIHLNGAAITVAFGGPDHIDDVARFEEVAGEGLADILGVDLIALQFIEVLLRRDIGFLIDAKFALVGMTLGFVFIADLKRFVAILLFGFLRT